MPTLVPRREGENLEAVFFGNIIELQPTLYSSAGYEKRYWSYNGGFRNLVPGETYIIRCPLANAQKQIRYGHLAVSHDALDPSDFTKTWSFVTNGVTTESYREWTVIAVSDTLDISMGLPATWAMIDEQLLTRWTFDPAVSHSPAVIGPDYEVARTPATVDQAGLQIPEQVQRMWRVGDGPFRILLITGLHAPETPGGRAFIHTMDLLLEEFRHLHSTCTFVCTHTVNPGRFRGHNRGYAVGANGSDDPNRQWGQDNPTTPFVTAIENALRIDSGGQLWFDMAIDCHSYFRGRARLYCPPGPSEQFFQYVTNRWRFGTSNWQNSTQAAAMEQWGAKAGVTAEWGGGANVITDQDYRDDMREILIGIDRAIADGFFSGVSVPSNIVDNLDAATARVGNWRESSASGEYNNSSEYCGSRPTKGCAGHFDFNFANGAGEHYLEIWYTWHPNRSARVSYSIYGAGGALIGTATVDQSDELQAGQWLRLGTFSGVETLRVHCDDGQASADAARLLPVSTVPPMTTLVEDIEALQELADELLSATGSPLAQEMVNGLSALRQRALNESYT